MKNKVKKYDFKEAEKQNSPEKLAWIKDNCNKDTSEEDFISIMKSLKRFSRGKAKNKNYSPSKLKKQYRTLKDNFGFFKTT